jgi:hypothetical protein
MATISGVLCMHQDMVPFKLWLTIHFQMVIYATLGVGQSLAALLNGITITFIIYSASVRMHDVCLSSYSFMSI